MNKTKLDDLRERIEADRACLVSGAITFPVAVSIDSSPLVYGTFHWEQEEPGRDLFRQVSWRELIPQPTWQIEAEIHLPTLGAFHELRWGEVDKQLYSGTAHHNSTRAELGGKIRTVFKGCGTITREDR